MSKIEVKLYSVAITAVVLVSLTAFFVTSAQADMTRTAPPTIAPNSFKAALGQFKHDRELFNAAMNERQVKMRDINVAFKNAVDKANSDLRTAISVASTPLQKSTAAANRRNAIDLAINARDLAISALGPMPTPPVEPIREDKQKSDKGQVEKNRR